MDLQKYSSQPSGRPFWDSKIHKNCARGKRKIEKILEKLVLGEPEFLAVFLKPLFDNFGAKMGQNHSVV